MIKVTPTLAIEAHELEERFVRASGPGGQNVNKVATAVQLRFDAAHSPSLPAPVRHRLLRLAGRRATQDGVVIIEARRHRTREQNRQDAQDRLVALIRCAAAPPPPPRKPTRPSRAAKARRLAAKRHRSLTKQRRTTPPAEG